MAMEITSYSPNKGSAGTTVDFEGSGIPQGTLVKWTDGPPVQAEVSPDGRSCRAAVPVNATTGGVGLLYSSGPTQEQVRAGDFYILPTIKTMSNPVTVGKELRLTGWELSEVTQVRFNGATANPKSKTMETLTVIVPTNAQSGAITLVTSHGNVKSSTSLMVKQPIKRAGAALGAGKVAQRVRARR